MVNVSIIVPVYNAKNYIKRCLDSCVSQTLQDIEIIVVDDASTDGTGEIVQKYVEEYPNRVKAIFQQKNSGYCTGINTGLKHAQGQYIVFVEADDWVELDTCERLWDAAVKNDADMVGGDVYIETVGGGVLSKQTTSRHVLLGKKIMKTYILTP